MRSLAALIRHQWRLLLQNRPACVVLAMFLAAALLTRWKPDAAVAGGDCCYVLYWQDCPWVRRLKAELPAADGGMRMEVAQAEEFVDSAGKIVYPRGAHSIQLRPPEPGRDHWLIWYWYSGADPAVLDGPLAWFWDVTRRHFGDALPVKVSPLEPAVPWSQTVRWTWHSMTDASRWTGPLVWATLFFCGCYLPAISLASQREHGLLPSLRSRRPAGAELNGPRGCSTSLARYSSPPPSRRSRVPDGPKAAAS